MNLRLVLLFVVFLTIANKIHAQPSAIKFSVPKAADNSQWENAPSGSTWSSYNKTVKLRVNLSRTGGDGYAGKKIFISTKILHPTSQNELNSKMDVFTVSAKNEGKFIEYFVIEYSFEGISGLPGNIPSCQLKVEVRIDDVVLATVTKKYKYE